jgi:hypothetical protein
MVFVYSSLLYRPEDARPIPNSLVLCKIKSSRVIIKFIVSNVDSVLSSFVANPTPRYLYFIGSSLNTLLKISLLLYRFVNLKRSLSKCAESDACPQGKCAAGAPNSFSKNLIAGIEPPSLIYSGFVLGFFCVDERRGRGREMASFVRSESAEALGPPFASTEEVVGEGLDVCEFCTSSFFGIVTLSAFSLLTAREDFRRC